VKILRKDIKKAYIHSKAVTVIRNSPRIVWKMATHLEKMTLWKLCISIKTEGHMHAIEKSISVGK